MNGNENEHWFNTITRLASPARSYNGMFLLAEAGDGPSLGAVGNESLSNTGACQLQDPLKEARPHSKMQGSPPFASSTERGLHRQS